jgi:hypothetical protein
MADQVFEVNAGFFNSINDDRLYSADEMNRPYKRVISNGVFATPAGTPSTDLQVVSAANGMNIIVKAGEGLFADKWFENPADITIAVPNNTNISPRRDSVIVQVDNTTAGRKASIVYRTGTPSTSPMPPAMGTQPNIIEYRLANIYVAAGASYIGNDAIVDLRGSGECPWITSLIYQVDTSQLYNQWQAAYQKYYDDTTAQFNEFMRSLTRDLSVDLSIRKVSTSYTTTSNNTTSITIPISTFNSTTDVLEVYINGLRAIEGTEFSISSNGKSIELTDALPSGQVVEFVVLQNIIGGGGESGHAEIEVTHDGNGHVTIS